MGHSIPEIGPPPRPPRGLITVAAIVMMALLLARGLPAFYVDYLWFGEVGYRHIFLTRIWAGVVMQLAFGGTFLVFFLANVLAAIRRAPVNVSTYHEMLATFPSVERVRPALRALAVLVGVVFALLIGS